MTTNIDKDVALASLKDYIINLLKQEFGSSDLFDLDDLLNTMIVYRDMHDLLQKPGVRLVLNKMIERATSSDAMVKELSDLNTQVEGLRCIHQIAVSDNPEKVFNIITSLAFLDETQIAQLSEIVQCYTQALKVVDDPDDVSTFDMDTDAFLRCLTSDVIFSYIDVLHASQQWPLPERMLFDFNKFGSNNTGDLLNSAISAFRLEFLRKENEYLAIVNHFKKAKQPLLEDSAQLLLFYTHIVRNVSASYHYIEAELTTIEQVLSRLDSYQPEEWHILEETKVIFNPLLGAMHMIMGGIASLPTEERFKHLEKAEHYYAETNLIQQCPSLRWTRAQLLPDFKRNEREKLETEALKQVYKLLTKSALVENPVDRVTSMATLMLCPAQWKIAKGDFRGAIENLEIAQSLALASKKVVEDEMGSVLEVLQKTLDDPDTLEGKEQLRVLHDNFSRMSEAAGILTYTCDLLTHICNAKLAESQGEFQEAEKLYEKAASLEQERQKLMIAAISVFLTMNSPSGSNTSQYGIKAIYFQGMARLNSGDQWLMEKKYSNAGKDYQKAKQDFKNASDHWETILVDPTSQADILANADREKNLSEDQMRYCDAKDEMAQAQEHSEYNAFMKASEHFSNAAGIFAGLYDASSFRRETERNLQILKGSEEFCQGCALFEMARNNKKDECRLEARRLVDSAALYFDKAGETRWAKYIRALRFEYEADIYMKLAYDSSPSISRSNIDLARSHIREAAGLFLQLDMKNRVDELELSAKSMTQNLTIISLPKPADSPLVSQDQLQSMNNQIKYSKVKSGQQELLIKEIHLDRLQAQASGNERQMKQIEKERNNGILDFGEYLTKIGGRQQTLTGILQEVLRELEGLDESFDAILLEALDSATTKEELGFDDDLIDRLVQVASQRGVPASTINTLKNKQQLSIFWLIEIGKQLMKATQS